MKGVEKRGLFVFGILVLFIIMLTGFSKAAVTCSASDQIILRLSDVTNAHGEVYNGAGNYTEEICYDTIFGVAGDGNRVCDGTNKIVGLSGSTNAHAESPSLSNYGTSVCYGDLSCRSTTGSCLGNESLVVTLSSSTNAHLATSGYNTNICCSVGGGAPPPPVENCSITSASWSVTEAVEGDPVDLDIVTSGCSDGTIVSFEVWEDDPVGDDEADTHPLDRVISGNSATGTWSAEWQEDGLLGGDPEWYFNISIPGLGEWMISSNQLTVTPKPPIPPYCNTVIICGNYYTASSGDPTAENACNIDKCGVAEFSVETKEEDVSCDDADINCICEWNTTTSVCNSAWSEILPPTGTCGDGNVDRGEQCDGTNFGAITSCSVFSLTDGTLDCYPSGNANECQFDTSGCVGTEGICGDNKINPGETCDGEDEGLVLSCTDFNSFDYGNLNCGEDCQFDTNKCFEDNDPPTTIGKCVYTEATTGSCEDDGFLISSWNATWTGSASSREASCESDGAIIDCPAQIQLAFFNLYNMLITLLAIAGIYGILSLRKKP